MTSAQWIDEFKAAEDMKRRETAEKEERRRKRKAALEENAALERMKAIMKSGGRKGAQCFRGGSRISGRGGLIIIFTSGGGAGGVPSPVTARGSGGTLINSSPRGAWGEAPAAFFTFNLRLFSMKIHILLTVIST